MKTYYVDTHCHLDLLENIQNRVAIEDKYPIKTITVTNAPSFFKANQTLFVSPTNIRVSIGLHPELSLQFKHELADFSHYIKLTRYIGEIGLDGSMRFKDSYDTQKEIFANILRELSSYEGKILSVHSRNAAKDVIDFIEQYNTQKFNKIILHWYSGNQKSLNRAIELGFYFSVNHKMLQSTTGLEILKKIPERLLLTETDAPFTFDDKIKTRMDSLHLAYDIIADTLGRDKEYIKKLIFDNFKKVLS